MKKLIFTFLLIVLVSWGVKAQRILINENFESTTVTTDSLPLKWTRVVTNIPNPNNPTSYFAARDTGITFPPANPLITSHAYQGKRSLTIPWVANNVAGIADQWVFTDSFTVKTGDSLIFWMQLGTPIWIPTMTAYLDTMQVHVCLINDPAGDIQKLATIKSRDSAGLPLGGNDWIQYKFNLSSFAGQLIYIGFRYYMNCSVDGLECFIDNVFVGNHAAVGINQIGTNVPKKFDLKQNYPNPFNPTTKVTFDLAKNSDVKITIFNTLGQEVKVLVNEYKTAGSYEASFDASSLSSGTYLYRMVAGNYVNTKKMTLIK